MKRILVPQEIHTRGVNEINVSLHDDTSRHEIAINMERRNKLMAGIGNLVDKLRYTFLRSRFQSPATETVMDGTAASTTQVTELKEQGRTTTFASSFEHLEDTAQEKSMTQLMLHKRRKEPENEKLDVDLRHFRKLFIPVQSNYWNIIFKGMITSFCVALNTFHLLNAIALFPPTFSIFRMETTNFENSLATTVSNIQKLVEDRVGLVVRWEQYSEEPQTESYANCQVLLNNYQWSQWAQFGTSANQSCGIRTYVRYYNLLIFKVILNTTARAPPTHCPATVQYKQIWDRACCPPDDGLQPIENYFNLSYDHAFCIINSSELQVNASKLPQVCKIGRLWTPLPSTKLINGSYYQQNKIVKNYEMQRGKKLNSYWIGVERIDGIEWRADGKLATFDSRTSCVKNCYDMGKLLSMEADMKYSSKKKHYVCVNDGKWELFSADDSTTCLAICITEPADNLLPNE